ncbi:MAG: FG-GAP-like repeat-containing protein [Bacteroidota bacterium]
MKKLFLPFLCTFFSMSLCYTQSAFMEVSTSGLEVFSGNEGIAVGDFDQDGLEDLYVSVPQGPNRLCRNKGDGTFEEIGIAAAVAVEGQSVASVFGDINNDGRLDLYVTVVNGNDHLFLNKGDGTFEDISLSAGIQNLGIPKSVNMADVNQDGWLDIYVTNFEAENKLYLNQQNLTFSDGTDAAGALDTLASMGTIFFDYDKDGDPDLYLVHDRLQANYLYQNDGTGRFTEVGQAAGVNTIGYGMGVDVGDIDNDGWPDIYVTNLFQNVLFHNQGDGTFVNIAETAGVNDNGMGWGTSFIDFDKDGLLDIYVANESDFFNPPDPNVLYRNMGDFTFEKVATDDPISNIDNSFGVACLDYNQDGSMDLLVANKDDGEHLQLFQNTQQEGRWLGLKLLGRESNRDGVGAKVELIDDLGKKHYRELTAGHGWASQNSQRLYFGLGDAIDIVEANIYWPSGRIQSAVFPSLSKNYTIEEVGDIREGIWYDLTTSIEPLETDTDLAPIISPNPAKDQFTLTLQIKKPTALQLVFYNLLGQRIYQRDYTEVLPGRQEFLFKDRQFAGHQRQGLLFLQIRVPKQEITRKILFQQ